MLGIVIPYYKIKYFNQTLESLAQQTDKRFKVYIGNDNSPENPLELLDKYADKIDFEYFYFKSNLGSVSLVGHWNRCLEKVKEEKWITILGDDDIYSPNVVEEFYKNLEEINSLNFSVIRYSTLKIDEDSCSTSQIFKSEKIENSKNILFKKKRSSLSEYIFKKSKLFKIGFKDLPLAWRSDVLAVLEASDFSDIYTINESQIKIRISEDSISGNSYNLKEKNKATFEFYYYIVNKHLKLFKNNEFNIIAVQFNKNYINDKKRFDLFLKIVTLYIKKSKFRQVALFVSQIFNNLKLNYFNA